MDLGTPIPALQIFDEAKAREFYCSFLGFAVDWEHRFEDGPLYTQISSGGCILHLSEHYGDASPGALIRVPIDDLDGFVASLNAKRYKYARPGIETLPYARECAIRDPFYNHLIFFTNPPKAA